jgi:DNA adenine methylase
VSSSFSRFSKEAYYEQRSIQPRELNVFAAAARFIYLNKTCFNGLYRENKKGEFNVPIGKFKSPPTICDEKNLVAVGLMLKSVQLFSGDFESTMSHATKGDFVYCDPPSSFGPAEQERLCDVALRCARRGVRVMLSNSDTPLVKKLYGKDFGIQRVEARRAINSKASRRGNVGELVITSY